MDEHEAVGALVEDLRWQIDQFPKRGIKDGAGNPYNPSHYKRGLQAAINKGGRAVPEFVASYLAKSPNAGFKKLEEADSLDLVCEALIADETKPYAGLFSEEERAKAKKRLAPYQDRIDARKQGVLDRIEAHGRELPTDPGELLEAAGRDEDPELAVAANRALLERDPEDVPSHIRLGRALEGLGDQDGALQAFERAVELAPGNAIAKKRLHDLKRKKR